MSEKNGQVDAESARKFLRGFYLSTREKGEKYFRQGAVRSLECDRPGLRYTAEVEGTETYHVSLFYDPPTKAWDADCTCPVGVRCKHAYAAMKRLLAENPDPASVLDLAPSAPTARATDGEQPVGLAGQLQAALGRKLNAEERRYVNAVVQVFRGSAANGLLHPNQFWQLGWPPPHAFDPIRIAPGRVKDDVELWHYLAIFAEGRRYPVPAFMRAIPLPEEMRAMVEQLRRKEEAERWRQTLASLPEPPSAADSEAPVELRLRLAREAIVVERRVFGAEWKELKTSRFEAFQQNEAGRLSPEAQLLWDAVASLRLGYYHAALGYSGQEVGEVLGQFLRLPLFRPFFANDAGDPLEFHETPARWRIVEPEADGGDYVCRLELADGRPLPPLIMALRGEPTLYLTTQGVFAGPPEIRLADGRQETRIPSESFESAGGLKLLAWMRAETPPRLAARVRTVRLRPHVKAELKKSPNSETEYCHVEVRAASENGKHVEICTADGWRPEDGSRPAKAKDGLVRVDRSGLAAFPGVMVSAGFRYEFYASAHTLRVTKKFPEQFLEFLQTLPKEATIELHGELASLQNAEVAGQIRLDATEAGIDWFDLQVVVDVSDTTLTQEEIKLLLAARGRWVRLGEKGWRKLEYKLTQEEDADLARLGLTPHELAAEPQRLHAFQLADKAARRFLPEETCARIERRATELKARVSPEKPAEISAELRPYQLEGFHFLAYLAANSFGGVLADDMGLGKTLQTLTWLAWLRSSDAEAGSQPVLVVCPKSVQDNWRAETERFCAGLTVKVWSGSAVKNLPALAQSASLHVINYNQLRLAGDKLARTDFLAVILDEGQYIKNPSSQTAQIARSLRAKHRLVLSGTPIENRLLDLWSLMAFAMPGALGSRAEFTRIYDAKADPFARQRLAARVRPFLLRRTKLQVARDLPDRVEEDLFCELEGEQKTLYRAELKRAQQMLLKVQTQSALNKERFHLLTSLLRLRQICCHPRLVKPDSKAEGAKVEALLETLETLIEEGQKVLVFSQFTEMLALLRESITARGWHTWLLKGDTEDRGELVADFQKHEGPGVFLISLKAGGFGLNLTASSYVVLFDPWWNPAVENQAIDRTHRIGQTQKVMAYRLLIKDSIEEKIRALQKQKSAIANDVLGEEKFAQALTLDDLRYLLSE